MKNNLLRQYSILSEKLKREKNSNLHQYSITKEQSLAYEKQMFALCCLRILTNCKLIELGDNNNLDQLEEDIKNCNNSMRIIGGYAFEEDAYPNTLEFLSYICSNDSKKIIQTYFPKKKFSSTIKNIFRHSNTETYILLMESIRQTCSDIENNEFSITISDNLNSALVKKERGKNLFLSILLFIGVVIVIIALAFGIKSYLEYQKNKPKPTLETINNTVEQTKESNSADTSIVTNPVEETTEPITQAPETTKEENLIELDYVGASFSSFPLDTDDYVTEIDRSGNYTFDYPADFFETGYYNPNDESYTLKTTNDQIVMTITKEEARVKNDPISCAKSFYNQLVDKLDTSGDVQYYKRISEEVSDTGYARCIMSGRFLDDPELGIYVCYACSNETVYTLKVYYPTENLKTFDYTPKGYFLDCIYRGWSLSGTSYKYRTWNQYLNNDMGMKKEE
ncbi:hypothetical protein P261_00360 [Lachnospiraceae bacterium TWA4]|nr:hypothetical protein P261_00360 [Lachnospiraceae bacterium TWA4]